MTEKRSGLKGKMEIVAITGSEIIPHLQWLQDVPKRKQVDSESTETIIIKTLQGSYHGLLGLLDGKPVGLLIYHMLNDHHISFKFLYGKTQMLRFYELLMEYFNQYSINSFEFESMHEPGLWNKLYPGSITALRTTYVFNVAGLFTETIKSLS